MTKALSAHRRGPVRSDSLALNNDKKVQDLLARSRDYMLQKAGYDDRHLEYIYCAPLCPKEQQPFGAVLEPVVPVVEYDVDKYAKVTINSYNALVLNTMNMFILDVDFCDRRIDKWGVANIHQLIGYMHDLGALDVWRNSASQQLVFISDSTGSKADRFLWSEQTWAIYTTQHGARVICTSLPFPLDDPANRREFLHLCRFLGADPVYAQKCVEQHCYRARLTAKTPSDAVPVCMSIHKTLWSEREPHPEIKSQLELHDQVSMYVNARQDQDM